MANSKTAHQDKNKKLTDFFVPKPSSSRPPSSPPMPSSSRPATPTTTATTATKSRALASSSRPATRALKALLDQNSTAVPSSSRQLRSASAMSTRKRPRSPDPIASSIHILDTPPHKLKSPRKVKQLDSDLDHPRRLKPTVTITSPFSPRKTASQRSSSMHVHSTPRFIRNSAFTTSPSDSSKLVVYSSQSDETELAVPVPESREFGKVVQDVQRWRQNAFESSNNPVRPLRDAMQVDPLEPSLASLSSSSPNFDDPTIATSVSSAVPQTPTNASACLPSPPDTNEPPPLPLPPTPKAINGEIKAAKIIAEIKARAFAASQSSDDEKPLEFRDLEDSDDDDLVDDLLKPGNGKAKSSLFSAPRAINDVFSSPLSSVPSTFNEPTAKPRTRSASNRRSPQPSPAQPTRASLRVRRAAPAFRLPQTIMKSSKAVGGTKTSSATNRKKSGINPLDALLREKDLADKRGTSSAALLLAEEAVKQGSREVSVESDDALDRLDRLDLADEEAAWKAVQEYRKSSSPTGLDDADDLVLGSREAKMLGITAGEAINKILVSDKARRGKEAAQNAERAKTLGVPLWIPSSDQDMEVDTHPFPPFTENHIIFVHLERLRKNDDDPLLGLILQSGILASVPAESMSSNVPQLLNLVLFASPQVADTIYIALREMWESKTHNLKLPFSAILSILCRLGANPSIFTDLGWASDGNFKNCMTCENLLEVVKRLLTIIKAAASANAFFTDDAVDMVLCLVLIGLDPLTLNDVRNQLNTTMDAVCNHGITDQLHPVVHEKVLGVARKLNPVNKARLISLFASGGGRTRYIAQRLAYCILVPTSIEFMDELPSLDPLILLLSPEAGSCGLFDVTNPSTDYEALEHYVAIITVALADIAPYVQEERDLAQSGSFSVAGSPSKIKKTPVSPLEHLRKVLEVMQSKIVDTRAAHLDRSRTKAALQRLTMRIFYERIALTGGYKRPRASTIQSYFTPRRD